MKKIITILVLVISLTSNAMTPASQDLVAAFAQEIETHKFIPGEMHKVAIEHSRLDWHDFRSFFARNKLPLEVGNFVASGETLHFMAMGEKVSLKFSPDDQVEFNWRGQTTSFNEKTSMTDIHRYIESRLGVKSTFMSLFINEAHALTATTIALGVALAIIVAYVTKNYFWFKKSATQELSGPQFKDFVDASQNVCKRISEVTEDAYPTEELARDYNKLSELNMKFCLQKPHESCKVLRETQQCYKAKITQSEKVNSSGRSVQKPKYIFDQKANVFKASTVGR